MSNANWISTMISGGINIYARVYRLFEVNIPFFYSIRININTKISFVTAGFIREFTPFEKIGGLGQGQMPLLQLPFATRELQVTALWTRVALQKRLSYLQKLHSLFSVDSALSGVGSAFDFIFVLPAAKSTKRVSTINSS